MANSIVIDAGPLLMLAREHKVAVEWLDEAVQRGDAFYCAGVTYAEVWRGNSYNPVFGKQAVILSKTFKSISAVPTVEPIGRRAGELIAKVNLGGGEKITIDAIVVATAQACRASIVTCDPDDIGRLAIHAGVVVQPL